MGGRHMGGGKGRGRKSKRLINQAQASSLISHTLLPFLSFYLRSPLFPLAAHPPTQPTAHRSYPTPSRMNPLLLSPSPTHPPTPSHLNSGPESENAGSHYTLCIDKEKKWRRG